MQEGKPKEINFKGDSKMFETWTIEELIAGIKDNVQYINDSNGAHANTVSEMATALAKRLKDASEN